MESSLFVEEFDGIEMVHCWYLKETHNLFQRRFKRCSSSAAAIIFVVFITSVVFLSSPAHRLCTYIRYTHVFGPN